jgi:hypothetical protein
MCYVLSTAVSKSSILLGRSLSCGKLQFMPNTFSILIILNTSHLMFCTLVDTVCVFYNNVKYISMFVDMRQNVWFMGPFYLKFSK